MMTYKDINAFLSHFNTNSYNRSQIGNDKQIIIAIYEFLKKLNISKDTIEILISNIAYLRKERINIPLYLEILSKSLGYINNYELTDVIKVTKDIHDIYYDSVEEIPLEEYIHDTSDARIAKLFLNRNNKYIEKFFTSDESYEYLVDLKLLAAIKLDKNEYKEFIGYLEDFDQYQKSYSPLLVFKTYMELRDELKDNSKLFFDILFGNEYLVGLNKNNIQVEEIYKKNIFADTKQPVKVIEPVQLDLFTYKDEIKPEVKENINCFQICSIFNAKTLPDYQEEKDLLLYYNHLLDSKEMIILPKLKTETAHRYIYETN
jgi:hypothetical protein